MTEDPKRPELGADETIVLRVLGGESALYEVLMRRHNLRIYRAVRSILGSDESEVEDVMQEAYVQAFAHLAQFRAEARFSTWLTRIAVHEAFARLRRGRKQVPTETERIEEVMNVTTLGPERHASDREIALIVERAIDELPETFRVVLVMRTLEDMSVAETAEVLGIPEDTVKTRLFRARAALSEALVDRATGSPEPIFGFPATRCNRVVNSVLQLVSQSSAVPLK